MNKTKKSVSILRDVYLLLLDSDERLLTDVDAIKRIATDYIKKSGIDDDDRAVMLKNIKGINSAVRMYDYFCNSMLVYEFRPYFYRITSPSSRRFTAICNDGNSDWEQ